jgi:hypothetical protein
MKKNLHQLNLKVLEEPKLQLKTSKKSKIKNKNPKRNLKKFQLQKQLQNKLRNQLLPKLKLITSTKTWMIKNLTHKC